MSAEATGWVWKNSPYSGAQLLVHLAIADVVNDAHDNEFWMSGFKLARKAKVSRATVTTTFADMQRDGLLVMLESGAATRTPSRFRFVMTSATTGIVDSCGKDGGLGQSNEATMPIDEAGLCQPPRAIPKEQYQEQKAEFSTRAKPDCPSCSGTGWRYYATAGREARCECTKEMAG